MSCKPRVLCNDVVKEIEKFIPWWDKCARYARACVNVASDVSGVNESVYSSSEEEEKWVAMPPRCLISKRYTH